jgi:hypothetical protein
VIDRLPPTSVLLGGLAQDSEFNRLGYCCCYAINSGEGQHASDTCKVRVAINTPKSFTCISTPVIVDGNADSCGFTAKRKLGMISSLQSKDSCLQLVLSYSYQLFALHLYIQVFSVESFRMCVSPDSPCLSFQGMHLVPRSCQIVGQRASYEDFTFVTSGLLVVLATLTSLRSS